MPEIRDDFNGLSSSLARIGGSGAQSQSFLGQIVSAGSFPTYANTFFAVAPCVITGDETEGGSATMVVDVGSIQYAYNCGESLPCIGLTVIVHELDNCAVFSYSKPAP